MKDKAYLVTGGAGFIGSHIAEFLLKKGARLVRVIDNLSSGSEENLIPHQEFSNFEFVKGDLRNPGDCKDACANIDFVSHQAAVGSVPRSIKNPAYTTESNVLGFINIAEAAKNANVSRFIFASSSSVYGDEKSLPKIESRIGKPLSPYAISKRTNELFADTFYNLFGLHYIGLRYFNVFGPRQLPDGTYAAAIPRFIRNIITGLPLEVHGSGNQTRDFTYVDNVVYANYLALTTENPEAINQVFNIATGSKRSINSLIDHLSVYLNKEAFLKYGSERKGDVTVSLASIEKARHLLSYEPSVSFHHGLKHTVEYFIKTLNSETLSISSQ